MADTLCLNTTVRNVSGQTLYFGFLGPRGKRLAAGEEFSVVGNLESLLNRNDVRTRQLFERAVQPGGPLAVVETPNPHIYDEGKDRTYMLDLQNGALKVSDPCWGQFSSNSGIP